jgi:outer membrane protein assembly factor BamB
MQNGSVTFALDAASGRLRWKHWTEPAYDALTTLQRQNPGFGPAGPLALAGTHLLVRTYLGLPAVFDTATGRRIPPGADLTAMQEKQYWMFGTRFSTSGQDTLVVDDRFILYGGYPLLGNPDMRVEKSAGKFIGIHLAEDGTIPGAGNPTWGIPSSLVAPALHGADILMVGGIGKTHRSENATSGLSLWEVKNWRDHIETLAGQTGDISDDDAADPAAQPRKSAKTAPTDAASRAKAARNKQAQNDVFGARAGAFFALDHAKARWHVPNIEINAVALCPDAALAVVGDLKTTADRLAYGEHPGFAAWNLIAFDRVTGKEHWRVALPDEPVYNGLAPAAGGAWVLALRDGSMAVVAPDATMPSVARGHGK